MIKQKALLVASLVLLLLGVGAWQCDRAASTLTPCPTCSPCPPTPDVPAVRTEVSRGWIATVTAVAAECVEMEEEEEPPPPPPEGCPEAIPPEEAIAHIGEFKTVQGIAYASYRPDVGGQPTYLNFCAPWPNHCFTALIWGDERPLFESCLGGPPEILLGNREICVSGLVELYRDKPQIILTQCDQVTIVQ